MPHVMSQEPSQGKSAPTPVGEPNVRAEAEKKTYMYVHTQGLYNLQSSLRKRGSSVYMEQKCRKVGSEASHRTAFFATISAVVPAEHFQFCVPSLLWAPTGTMCLEMDSDVKCLALLTLLSPPSVRRGEFAM